MKKISKVFLRVLVVVLTLLSLGTISLSACEIVGIMGLNGENLSKSYTTHLYTNGLFNFLNLWELAPTHNGPKNLMGSVWPFTKITHLTLWLV